MRAPPQSLFELHSIYLKLGAKTLGDRLTSQASAAKKESTWRHCEAV
jgi:hypothetical protein